MIEEDLKPEALNYYSFFTKYSLMEEYGFSSGLMNRLFRKVLPVVPDENTIEYVLHNRKDSIPFLLSTLDHKNESNDSISSQLDLSIKALCSKVVAFGIDSDIKAKYEFLGLDASPFENLLHKLSSLKSCNKEQTKAMIISLEEIEMLISKLRKNKNKIGTNFHLTLTTRKNLEYTKRIKELLDLKLNLDSKKHWENLFLEYKSYSKRINSLSRYIDRHFDLVALEIVEHTSNKGQKYIAENRKEYWKFFFRSLLGGGIISLFAFAKLYIDSWQLTDLGYAFCYSINYAICFIIVKHFGGIIATKQPAMTASKIAKSIDSTDDLKIDSVNSITSLVRRVFRSQFISVMGNFLMALTLSSCILYILQILDLKEVTKIVKPDYLIKNVVPTAQLICFAAVAGFYLAMSGLISGYVDNKVVASKFGYRIRNSELFFKSTRLAYFVEKKVGALVGNICLGFLLGSTFLLSNILPFQLGIRHIAFSSANVGYAMIKDSFSIKTMLLALCGALLIGFVNFIVSFSITLYLALKSRGANFKLIPKILGNIGKDFFFNPFHYFYEMND